MLVADPSSLEKVGPALLEDGVIKIVDVFDPAPVMEYLGTKKVYNAHVKAKATSADLYTNATALRCWPMFSWTMEDIVTAPSILESALMLYPVVRDCFQEIPLLYSMNCFGTQPALDTYLDTHYWHRDGDDRKQLVAFFMLTDIPTPVDGAHLFQKGSHKSFGCQEDSIALGYNWKEPPSSVVETVTGSAGDVFMTDTRGMHMAHRPKTNPRIVAWARFGVSDPPISYIWDKLSPVSRDKIGERYPVDPVLQHAIHLVCQ